MFNAKMVLYHLRFPWKGSKVGCSVQHYIHHQIDIAYCSPAASFLVTAAAAVWAVLFQSSALNQLLAREQNSAIDSAIILCSFEHLGKLLHATILSYCILLFETVENLLPLKTS